MATYSETVSAAGGSSAVVSQSVIPVLQASVNAAGASGVTAVPRVTRAGVVSAASVSNANVVTAVEMQPTNSHVWGESEVVLATVSRIRIGQASGDAASGASATRVEPFDPNDYNWRNLAVNPSAEANYPDTWAVINGTIDLDYKTTK